MYCKVTKMNKSTGMIYSKTTKQYDNDKDKQINMPKRTKLTGETTMTRMTRVKKVTRVTRMTMVTRVTRITQVT